MSPFNIGDELSELRSRTLRIPRRRSLQGAGLVIVVVIIVVALGAAIYSAVRPRATKAPRASTKARASVKIKASPKWRELQVPLSAVARSGREEQPITFAAKNSADPFAPDLPVMRGQSVQLHAVQLDAGRSVSARPQMDEVSRILSAAAGAPESPAVPVLIPGEPLPEKISPEKGPSSPADQAPPPDEGSVPAATVAQVASGDRQEAAPPGSTGGGAQVEDSGAGARPPQESRPLESAQAAAAGAPSAGGGDTPGAGAVTGRNRAAGQPLEEGRGPQESLPPPRENGEQEANSAQAPLSSENASPPPQTPPDAGNAGKGDLSQGREAAPEVPAAAQKPRVSPPLLLLTGVISAGDLAYAIVRTPSGSSIVQPGDEVDGMRVESIEGKTIRVIRQGEEFVIELGGGGKR